MGEEAMDARFQRSLSDWDLAGCAKMSSDDLQIILASGIFDEHFYLVTYPDIARASMNPFEHYLLHGRSEGRRPSAVFDPRAYLEANPEVAARGFDPLVHYVSIGRAAGAPLSPAEVIPPRPALTREIAAGTERLIIFLTPAAEELRTGGILSIDAIYRESTTLTALHGAKVALCAVPGDDPLLVRYSWFENASYLLDLTAVLRSCADLRWLQLHIPEGGVNRVARWLEGARFTLLRNLKEIHLNILLQNIDLIQGQDVATLKRFGKVTATTAHEAYSNAATREMLGVPLRRLGVWLGRYNRRAYRDKEPILVVSHDEHPLKEHVLGQIARALPQVDIRVIQNLSYEEYKELVSRAKWSLTFGEGLDSYFVEMVLSGGNAFAVFNGRFFTAEFAALETVYPSWDILRERIVGDLQRLDESTAYERCWERAHDLVNKHCILDQFRENIRAFYRGEYDFP
jgi:hypothetical protein